jgi:hypothetical protein
LARAEEYINQVELLFNQPPAGHANFQRINHRWSLRYQETFVIAWILTPRTNFARSDKASASTTPGDNSDAVCFDVHK